MRYEHEGLSLWTGTPDAPAPGDTVSAGAPIPIMIGVQPANASNQVDVIYRVNKEAPKTLRANWIRNDSSRKTQYFKAEHPAFLEGDTVTYTVLCRCAGRQVPAKDATEAFTSSFTVVEAGVEGESNRAEKLTSPSRSSSPLSTNDNSPSGQGNLRKLDVSPATLTELDTLQSDAAIPNELRNFTKTNDDSGGSLKILASGHKVRRLQKTLIEHGISINTSESLKGNYGLSTREAVRKFQKQQGLNPTGIADATTHKVLSQRARADGGGAMRSVVSRRANRSFRKISKLGFTARKLKLQDKAVAEEVRGRMVSALKQRLVELFDQPSETMVAAIDKLAIDLDEVEGLRFTDFVFTKIAPELMREEVLERELFEIAERELEPETDTVAELLGMDRDVRDSENLRDLVNKARNEALGDIVALDDEAIDELGDIDLLERRDAVSRLVENDKLTEKQRDEILVAADLARLTDDNFDAIRALRESGVREPRELVTRGKSDWLRFIEDKEIEPPDGETAESYASILDAGVEHAFRSVYALTRYAAPVQAETLSRLSVLEHVSDTEGPIFADGGVRKNLKLSTVSGDEVEAVRTDLSELARFSNRYAGLGITDILNDRDQTSSNKRKLIQKRLAALEQAWMARPELDLDRANFIPIADPTAQAFTVELDDIDPKDRPHVRRALMDVQRVYRLSDSYDEVDNLMAAGLNTAPKIAATDDADRLAELTGLKRPAALRIRAHALETRARMMHFVHGLEDATGHALYQPVILNETGTGGNGALINVLKDLPGYSDLFGPQNYCKCRHCQSIFSPSAYFVDLMRFIDRKISAPNFTDKGRDDHPLYLKNRRSDLWSIPLTCENTDRLVIYLTIVNEVLKNYLESDTPVSGDVFEYLAIEAKSSFRQPFNLPHAEILLYLEHLGVDSSDVSALFDPDRKAATHTTLGISPQELATLATAQPGSVRLRFAKPSSEDLSVHDTAILTTQIGVDREMLERLLASDYVVADVHLETELKSATDDLVGFVEHVQIDLPGGSDTDSGLRAFLDRLHRFARLVRALGWTPEEVQLAIDALKSSPTVAPNAESGDVGAILDADMLSRIADLKRLADGLGLSVSEAIALCHRIPNRPTAPETESLWSQLFGEHQELTVRHPALGNTKERSPRSRTSPSKRLAGRAASRSKALVRRDVDEPPVSSDFGVLQGALGIAEPDLIALLQRQLPKHVLASGVLNEDALHRLFRSARLARALDLSQQELAALEGIVPSLTTDKTVNGRLSALVETMQIVRQFDDPVLELRDLLEFLNTSDDEANRPLTEEILDEIHAGLQENDKLWLTAGDLSRIEGVTPAAARAIIEHLVNRGGGPWLTHPDKTVERYRLNDVMGVEPDTLVLQEALSVPGAPLAGLQDDDHAIAFLTTALGSELVQHHPAVLVREMLANTLALSGDMLEAFDPLLTHLQALSASDIGLSSWLRSGNATQPVVLTKHALELVRLKRLFVDTLDAKSEAVAFVAGHQMIFGIAPGEIWTWPSLHRIASFIGARRGAEEKIQTLQVALTAWDGGAFPGAAAPNLALYFNVTTSQIDELLVELPQDGDAFDALRRIADGVRLTQRTSLDPTSLRQLISESYTGLLVARDLVLGAMRTKHPGEDAWRTLKEPFLEKIEGFKRDTLVDRILSRPELRFDNVRDIYHFFLLDAEMDGCFRTSRVKNAISTCQLYVQRCLMGLEQQADKEDGDVFRVKVQDGSRTREEWKWRKSYRVWEANRKVFLYPENYMLPDLRDHRSHIFKIAERDLLQGNLDNDTIEQVFKRYLSEFVQIGSLEIVHVLYVKRDGVWEYLLFGRTQQEPFRYFMRRFNGKKHWEPWEPIDIDISARTISAVMKRDKLYMFWSLVDLDADGDKIKKAQPTVQKTPDKNNLELSQEEKDADRSRETMPITISYSTLNEAGNWSSPQDILYYNLVLNDGVVPKNVLTPFSDTIYAEYPHSNFSIGESGIEDFIRLIHPVMKVTKSGGMFPETGLGEMLGFLRESDNKTVQRNGNQTSVLGNSKNSQNSLMFMSPGLVFDGVIKTRKVELMGSTAEVDYEINSRFNLPTGPKPDSDNVLEFNNTDLGQIRLRAVQRKTQEFVLRTGRRQYLTKLTGKSGYNIPNRWLGDTWPDLGPDPISEHLTALSRAKWKLVSLDSTWSEALSQTLYSKGVSALLAPEQQLRSEPKSFESIVYHWFGQVRYTDEDFLKPGEHAIAQFNGPHGSYLWEIFFHLPFLIAHTFNSIGKFEEADRWYRRIFDPMASGDEPNAHWRFVVFRTLKISKLRQILTQGAAINSYKQDPFNPWAIARLRPSAFEKTIVMRYIDNLLDWGDELFRRDTRESINEALLLYVMAADLLGKRPVETGECEVADSMTYSDIQLRNTGGEFLVELENLVRLYWTNLVPPTGPDFEYTLFTLPGSDPDEDPPNPAPPTGPDFEYTLFTPPDSDPDENPPNPVGPGTYFSAMTATGLHFEPFATVRANRMAALIADADASPPAANNIALEPNIPDPDPPAPEPGIFDYSNATGDAPDPDGPVYDARTLGFCVPPNETLLGYWDRVEDRLYKLRHCMNIEGVERQLPLWQPPIDPMLLVRAKAAGLELDDVLTLINQQPPQHRFEVLLERARRFTATTQQLGNQLLSALERKDENELTLLRSVHEDTVLTLSRRQKEDAITEAMEVRSHLDSIEHTITTRRDHYISLLDGDFEPDTNREEKTVLDEMQSAKDRQDAAGEAEAKAQRYRELGPQWTAGTIGELGTKRAATEPRWSFYVTPFSFASGSVSWGSVNIEAKFQRRAFRNRDASSKHSASAGMASTRASYARRREDWELQRDIAVAEIDALAPQKAAADIRIALNEKELETHDAQIKNSRELYDFAKERFTSLGLYTYLSTSLSRLHREAYDMAFKMAQMAERAYRFEIGEDSFFLKPDNWNASRAGLLAADRLFLQLQAMEANFVERDRRRQEVTLPCSLSQIDPDALVRLRQTGRAELTLPEWWFDLFYPGQYRRMLQAVRLTIPCVTGPYSNVGAKLTLVDSAIRATPSTDPDALVGVQVGRNTSISTSSANSDPGVFELRFDAPKNPPFKGAGAVSSWALELPSVKNCVFDYSSISDVIFELSYTAEDDSLLRNVVEGSNDEPSSLDARLEDGLVRTISLRHEFPSHFHKLKTTGQETTEPIDLSLNAQLFPYWVSHRQLQVTHIDIALEPKSGRSFSMADIQGVATIVLNGETLSNWAKAPNLGSIPVTSSASVIDLGDDPVVVSIATSLPDSLELHDLLIRLTYSTGV